MFNLLHDKTQNRSFIPTADSLLMTGDYQERWLSRPDSRIVINPFNFDEASLVGRPQSDYCNRPTLPLNIGFLDPWVKDSRGPEINNALMLFEKSLEITSFAEDKLTGPALSEDKTNATTISKDKRIAAENHTLTDAVEFSTTWQPHKSGFSGTYRNGMTVSGYDFFYDARTIVRCLIWEGSSKPVIAGEYKGTVSAEAARICVYCGNYRYAIAFGQKTNKPKFFRSFSELIAGTEPASEPYDGHGYFMLELLPDYPGNAVAVAITMDTRLVDMNDIAASAERASKDPDMDLKRLEIKQFWDGFLSKIPSPGDFEFRFVDTKGITSYDIMLRYYTGWVLLEASLAPASPEVGFNYRQLTAGKPSLWGFGDPRAVYTAAWDSLYGIQMLAFVDPDAAWEAFTGIMSMVDRDGMLAGESLPVMRARTCWILYQCKPDKSLLKVNFDNIERNLLWELDHPYWIWMGNNPLDSTLKDVDFTAAALIDIPYIIKICHELGEKSKAEFWQNKYDSYLKDFIRWTFPGDGSLPTQTYQALPENDDGSGLRSKGNALWVTKSLHIKGLDKFYVDRIMSLFRSEFDPDKSFCGFSFVKVEEIQYTIYGLMENGFNDEANKLMEASVRDVVRSRFHGENYTNDDQPVCWGVRPSLFGVVQLIDGIWLRNGFRYDTVTLARHGLFEGQ